MAKSCQRKGREEQKNEVQDALEAPLTPTCDGALGLWAALNSVFSGVRLRTDATRRMRRRDNALYLVFQIVERLSQNWRDASLKMAFYSKKLPELAGARS